MGKFIKKLLILILGCNVVSLLISLPFLYFLYDTNIVLWFLIVALIIVFTLVYFFYTLLKLIKKYL